MKPIQARPAPVRANIVGTWAHYSIVKRLPEICERIIKENSFPEYIVTKLKRLISEIPNSTIVCIGNRNENIYAQWNSIIQPYQGENWLQVPWLFAEFYFYWRVLHAVGYFEQGEFSNHDPYQFQKEEGLKLSVPLIDHLIHNVEKWKCEFTCPDILNMLLNIDLFGNKMDLSIWPVEDDQRDKINLSDGGDNKFVINQTNEFMDWVSKKHVTRIDFLLDNVGFELLCDLYLADFLIAENDVKQIIFHLKPYPIFVSDALTRDVIHTIDYLVGNETEVISQFGKRLRSHINHNRLVLADHLFWGLPNPMWKMPGNLRQQFLSSTLMISKGDANYRRMLGDLMWDITRPAKDALSYLPTACLLLRILKSEIGIGFSVDTIKIIEQEDKPWMVDGQWGVIQFWSGEAQ